jgi:hypothetical protein
VDKELQAVKDKLVEAEIEAQQIHSAIAALEYE